MLRFILSRLLATLPVLLVVAAVVFMLLRLAPGDPAVLMAGENATPQDIAGIRRSLGLDASIATQFLIYLQRIASIDLGHSFYLNKPVTALIAQRLGATLSLALGTISLAVLVAVPLGTLAAWRRGGWLDRTLMSASVLFFSAPVFVIGYLLILVFALQWQWLPVQGYVPLDKGLWPWARQLVLPCMSLATVYMALLARVTRASVSETLTEDYIRTAQAKGLKDLTVLLRHALANAAVPIVTVIGIGVALLIGGVVVTETVFAIPGLGSLTVDAVLNRDFPLVQGLVLFFAVCYVGVNLLIDLSYLVLDPRIRY